LQGGAACSCNADQVGLVSTEFDQIHLDPVGSLPVLVPGAWIILRLLKSVTLCYACFMQEQSKDMCGKLALTGDGTDGPLTA
jgi:hypothetical protein